MKKKFAAALCTLSILVAALAAVVPLTAAEAESAGQSRQSVTASAASERAAWPNETARLVGRFILSTGTAKTFVAVPSYGAGGDLATTAWPAESVAYPYAVSWIFPAPGTTGPVSRADQCLNVGVPGSRVTSAKCNGGASQDLELAQVSGGWAIRSVSIPGAYVDFDAATNRLRAYRVAAADTLRMHLLAPVSYRDIAVTSVTPGAVGEAVVTGTATSGASIHLGSDIGEASSTGEWSMKATGIPTEGATLTIGQSIGGTAYGSTRATVPAWPTAPEAPTAAAEFDDDVHKNVTVSGTGAEDATVTVRIEDAEIATARVTNGEWSTDIAAPGPGSHDLAITQTVGGHESSPVALTVDYGDAVSIVAPEDGDIVQPGEPLDFTGRGEPGSRIELRLDDSDVVVGTATVEPDGTWSIPGIPGR